jgi:transposase
VGRAQKTPQSVALRARIVLAAAAGASNSEVARTLGVSRPTVIMWRRRFAEGGAQGVDRDEARPWPQAIDLGGEDQADRAGLSDSLCRRGLS